MHIETQGEAAFYVGAAVKPFGPIESQAGGTLPCFPSMLLQIEQTIDPA